MQQPKLVYKIYDNDGRSFDRYTILIKGHERMAAYCESLSLSSNPDSPLGLSQWGDATEGNHLGREIVWSELSPTVQTHIARRLESD